MTLPNLATSPPGPSSQRSLTSIRACAALVILLAGGVLPAGVSLAQSSDPPSPSPTRRPAPTPDPKADPKADPSKPAPSPTRRPPAAPPQAPSSPTAPATPPPAMERAAKPAIQLKDKSGPKLGEFVRRTEPRDSLLQVRLEVLAEDPREVQKRFRNPKGQPAEKLVEHSSFAFDTLRLLFPLVLETSTSHALGDLSDWGKDAGVSQGFRGRMYVGDTLVDTEPELLPGYAAGAIMAAWDAPPTAGMTTQPQKVWLTIEAPVRAWKTEFDEQAAMQVGWPSTWPAQAQSALQPQLYVEKGINAKGEIENYDPKPLENAIKTWLADENIRDPRSVPPVRLAKILAGKVWGAVMLSGDASIRRERGGDLLGVEIKAPSVTLADGRGTAFDMVALLTAVYRQVGIPARTVVGIDLESDDNRFLSDNRSKQRLSAWVEFYLYDGAANVYNWVPVDIARLRQSASRPTRIDADWRFFGNHRGGNGLYPFALQFHPPTDVAAYGNPLFWGWFVTPQTPASAFQRLDVRVGAVSRIGGQEMGLMGEDKPQPNAPAPGDRPSKKDDKKGLGK